jgi:hypothetical protein
MGFLVSEFNGLDYMIYKDLYVSIQSFSITRVNSQWMCTFFLQAHRSREEKKNGVPGIFLSYWVQTKEIEITDLALIIEQIYAEAKKLYGEEKCTDVYENKVVPESVLLEVPTESAGSEPSTA